MKLFFLSLALSFASSFAGTRADAYELICKQFTFESTRNECMEKISKASYFENRAIEICTTFRFDSSKMDCLVAIIDKVYENYEADHCNNQTFESGKIDCLQKLGSRYSPNCLSNRAIIIEAQRTISEIHTGLATAAISRQQNLINYLSRCPNN